MNPAQPPKPSNTRLVWVAFLLVCFLLTGLVGLFASYGPLIPMERGLNRLAALDRAAGSTAVDEPALQLTLGRAGTEDLLRGPGPMPERLARARAAIIAETRDETAGVAARTRLMVYVVTLLSALFGSGILLIVMRQKPT